MSYLLVAFMFVAAIVLFLLPSFILLSISLKLLTLAVVMFSTAKQKISKHSRLIKEDRNPNDKYVYKKELNKSCILIPVLSKSVEKWRSCGRLNIFKWTVMEAAIL